MVHTWICHYLIALCCEASKTAFSVFRLLYVVQSSPELWALGLRAPAKVLLAGPPGCGKTLLAKANKSGLNFIYIKGTKLLNMDVGESKQAMHQVFQRGQYSVPCVIFFNEIDALCPRCSGHEIITQYNALFGVKVTSGLRELLLYIPFKQTVVRGFASARRQTRHIAHYYQGGTKPRLDIDVNLEEIVRDERCNCFTGADLAALVREASFGALGALYSQTAIPHAEHTSSSSHSDISVSRQNFEEAFKKMWPSVSKQDQLMCEKLRELLTI
ncbi:nuclear valosin-containing protein-like [Tachysurus ichikawai]